MLGLLTASKLYCDNKVAVTPDPTTLCLSSPPGCCHCSMLEVGKLKFRGSVTQLSSQGQTAGTGWRQDLNPELSGSPAPWYFYYMGCPFRNNTFGWFINNTESAEQPTNIHKSVISPKLCTSLRGAGGDYYLLSQMGTWRSP